MIKRKIISLYIITEFLFFVLIIIGLIFRFIYLDNIPGINGDEPFFGVKAINFIDGVAINWQTGSGLPMNPFFFIPSILLHTIFPPSFMLLRLQSAIYGCFSVFICYFLFRKSLPKWECLSLTLFIAVLPVSIAYSRISWDPSQSLLFIIVCVYYAKEKKYLHTIISFICCIIVHPTNIFLMPFILYPFIEVIINKFKSGHYNRKTFTLKKILIFIFIFFVLLLIVNTQLPYFKNAIHMNLIFDRLFNPYEYIQYCFYIVNLFNGITPYTYFIGDIPELSVYIYFFIFILLVIPVFIFSLRPGSGFHIRILCFLFSIFFFYIAAGAVNIAPHRERYALWMIVPGIILYVQVLYKEIGHKKANAFSMIIAFIFLINFSNNYFNMAIKNNCNSQQTFLTGKTDPKQLATEWICRQKVNSPRVIYTENWWLYWPVKYLISSKKENYITILNCQWDKRFPKDFDFSSLIIPDNANIYYIAFQDSPLFKCLSKDQLFINAYTATGYPDKTPLISVFIPITQKTQIAINY